MTISMALRKNCVLIHFDADLATESHARPNYRPPPITETLAKKLIYGALAGRGAKAVKTNSEPDCPIPGDLLCILDGGRDSPALMTPFKQSKGRGLSIFLSLVLEIEFESMQEAISRTTWR